MNEELLIKLMIPFLSSRSEDQCKKRTYISYSIISCKFDGKSANHLDLENDNMDKGTITCPKCGHDFELSNALTHQIREHLKTELQADMVKREADAKRKLDDVKAREDALAKEKQTLDAEVEKQLTQKLAEAGASAAKKAEGSLTLESDLRYALERKEFHLHYQPKRDIHSGRVTGMEALLRWQHPELGAVAPTRFIPFAEETGLMVPIGKWVLSTACRQNVAWQNQGLPHVSMAVNLTARQFYDENLLPDLAAILETSAMDARLLELEISESLLLRDVEKTFRVLSGFKGMGIRIAIDDFGIGSSSLSTLKQFPLDTIKIDRSFIRDVSSVAEDKNLTEAVIAMARTLNVTVVAQGVETKEQIEYLRHNAWDEFQGFYLNKPEPGDQIAELLRKLSDIADTDTRAPDKA